jgi:hypothetical protein
MEKEVKDKLSIFCTRAIKFHWSRDITHQIAFPATTALWHMYSNRGMGIASASF